MNGKSALTSLWGTVLPVLICVAASVLTATPARALHECGSPHWGKSDRSIGCKLLRESDFF